MGQRVALSPYDTIHSITCCLEKLVYNDSTMFSSSIKLGSTYPTVQIQSCSHKVDNTGGTISWSRKVRKESFRTTVSKQSFHLQVHLQCIYTVLGGVLLWSVRSTRVQAPLIHVPLDFCLARSAQQSE